MPPKRRAAAQLGNANATQGSTKKRKGQGASDAMHDSGAIGASTSASAAAVVSTLLCDPTEGMDDAIALPEDMCLEEGCDLDALVEWVFPDLAARCTDTNYISQRAILVPHNTIVDEANAAIAAKFPGSAADTWVCESADRLADDDDALRVPVELLNTLNVSGLPHHKLELKKNMPVMLLRNLDPKRGLCNGTRLLVRRVINGRVLEAKIATGKNKGDIVFLPRITLRPEDGAFPYVWSRRQFPVRLAFAMTIHKSQGQTLERVGVYLKTACFTHGQLYVAASRVGSAQHLKFALDRDADGSYRTPNVVWREGLTPCE